MAAILDDEAADLRRATAELQRRLDEALSERDESEAQKAAMAEILEVINSSPGDLAPVFDAMLEKAIRVCDAIQGTLWRFGERIQLAASQGLSAELVEALRERRERQHPGEKDPVRRIMRGERLIQILDVATDRSHGRAIAAGAEFGGVGTIVFVALVKDATPLGAFAISRREMRRFTDKHIALLQNFAEQAVIAMENARLLTETREALEQQTATAEVLQVINSSPGDLAPVFEAMLEKALHLCEAAFGLLHTYDGERFRALAVGGVSGAAAEPLREWVADSGSALEQIVRGDRVVHIPDVVDTDAYRSGVTSRLKLVKLTGARTALWVALRKDDALIGVFVIYRREVRPFSDKQIALLENFAAQAVIAWRMPGSSPRPARHWTSRPLPPRCCRYFELMMTKGCQGEGRAVMRIALDRLPEQVEGLKDAIFLK
jgi:two-component system NtrC family sensor kinase